MSFISPVTNVLYTAVSFVLLRWHQLLSAIGMDPDGGMTWALSIVLLVITARLLLFRFFIKQVHYQRQMQELQPQIAKLKEKHKGDRQALNKAMMELQQEQGMNALAGCLPLILQAPVFLALFHVLRHLANASQNNRSERNLTLYGFSRHETLSAANAKLFGDAPLASSFHDSASKVASLGGSTTTLQITAVILAVISAGATFMTQRQAARNATTPASGQAAQIQKVMMYMIPLFVLGSAYIFPLGVLIYWFTSNLWTLGQQFYIFRFHPHTPSSAKSVDAAPVVRRAAAPAPGAKPNRNRRAAPAGSSQPTVDASVSEPSVSDKSAAEPAVRSNTPRPGARPANARPKPSSKTTAKRPGQRSKRR